MLVPKELMRLISAREEVGKDSGKKPIGLISAKELSQINFSKFTLLLYDIYARGLMVCMGRPNRLGERQISRAHRYPPFLKLCPLGREHDGPLCQMPRASLHYGTNTRLCALCWAKKCGAAG